MCVKASISIIIPATDMYERNSGMTSRDVASHGCNVGRDVVSHLQRASTNQLNMDTFIPMK